jgi:cytidylate kinase
LPPAVPSRVICISHTTGAGGDEVARGVAARLGFRYVDEAILAAAAERHGVDPSVVADVEKRRSFIRSILEAFETRDAFETAAVAVGGVVVPQAPGPPHAETASVLREVIRDAIRETAERGDVVIASHAASFALTGMPDLLRVLVTASEETRRRRLAAQRELGERDAADAIRESDAGRADYLKRFYDVDRELPTQYDIVVNTDALSVEDATGIVANAAER